jgi:hypothetical protein
MKNIFLIPTEKPSRLFYNVGGALLFTDYENYNGVNIYITNNEDIREGDWCYQTGLPNLLEKCKSKEENWITNRGFKKIILTTNKQLIADGVQEISEDFLQWFVKNPSCEFVEVSYEPKNFLDTKQGWEYEIIIPEIDILDMGQIAEKEETKTTGDISVDYSIAQSKAIQKCMQLDAEIAYKSLPKQDSLIEKMKPIQEQWQKDMDKSLQEPKQEPFKHECRILSKEEVLANRSNAYEFIDFDKQETIVNGKCTCLSPQVNCFSGMCSYCNRQIVKQLTTEDLKPKQEKDYTALLQPVGTKHISLKEQNNNFYSEEEVLDILRNFYTTFDLYKNPQTNTIPLWFEKFKNI